jgi:hypothetical protein
VLGVPGCAWSSASKNMRWCRGLHTAVIQLSGRRRLTDRRTVPAHLPRLCPSLPQNGCKRPRPASPQSSLTTIYFISFSTPHVAPTHLDPLRLHPPTSAARLPEKSFSTHQAVFCISSIRLSPRLLQRPCFTSPNSVMFAVLVSIHPGPLDLIPL